MLKPKLLMSLKIWISIYPSITLFLFLFNDALSGYPLPLKTLILTLVLVPWVVFAGVPAVDFIQRKWIHRTGKTGS
ncbi:MAG TPA: hypothetical protein PKK99_04805 [Bacteroidia bacterium]|nr:hypothetical protein [Bacteroidia bacterium]